MYYIVSVFAAASIGFSLMAGALLAENTGICVAAMGQDGAINDVYAMQYALFVEVPAPTSLSEHSRSTTILLLCSIGQQLIERNS